MLSSHYYVILHQHSQHQHLLNIVITISPYTNTASTLTEQIQYHVTLHQYSQHQHLQDKFSTMSPYTNTVGINTYCTNSISCHPKLIQSASTLTEQIRYHVTVHQYSQYQHLLDKLSIMPPYTKTVSINNCCTKYNVT